MTILCNKFDGHPKGFAYVEFSDKDSVSTAMALDDSLFRGRQIKVRVRDYLLTTHRSTESDTRSVSSRVDTVKVTG